jgi:signal transduction histidine kinase
MDRRALFLTTTPVDRNQQRLMAAFMLLSLLGAVGLMPLAQMALPPLPAFVAISQTALAAFDIVTAALLFGKLLILRSRALLALACGYLFAALMAIAYILTFPGAVSPTGLLHAGIQTTAWLYWFWHGGFLLSVIAYALLKQDQSTAWTSFRLAIIGTPLAAIGAATVLILLATIGEPLLPAIMVAGNRIAEADIGAVLVVGAIGLYGIALLWRLRPQTGLDLWLIAVVWTWLLDVLLSTVLSDARFQLGFYVGRLFGLLGAGLVLAALVMNINRLYGRQVAIVSRLGKELADMRRLHAISTQLADQAELLQMLEGILDATISLQHADFGNIQLYDPSTGTLRIAVHRGFPKAFLEHFAVVSADDGSVCARAMRLRETVVVQDVMHDREFAQDRRIAQMVGFRSVQSAPIFGRDGEFKGVLSTHFRQKSWISDRDLRLTDLYVRLAAELIERAEGERALREAARVAEQANRTKDRFLMTASHDLRQPLQSLSLLNGVLQRLVDEERAVTAVARQEQAITTMSDLLNSLLDISKLEAGAVKPHVVDVSLDELFEKLGVEFAVLAAAKGLQLDVAARARCARSDPALLGQILRNFLSNAIRYTHSGTVCLLCEHENDFLRIDVRDTGVGIAQEHLTQIFEEFYQIGVSPNATREGHGLGLSVVQRVARLLKHEIRVRSEPGEGSVFSILVPVGLSEGRA